MKTFFASSDFNNDFYDTLIVFNLIYRVSGTFPTYLCNHTTNISNHIQGKWALVRFFEARLSESLEYSIILLRSTDNVKMNFHNFQMMFTWLTIPKFVTWKVFQGQHVFIFCARGLQFNFFLKTHVRIFTTLSKWFYTPIIYFFQFQYRDFQRYL